MKIHIKYFRRLGFKIVSPFLLIGILPLFIGIVFLFKYTEGLIRDDACNNLGLLAKNTEEEVCRFIDSCVADMKVLAESEGMRNTEIHVDKKLLEMKIIQDYYKRLNKAHQEIQSKTEELHEAFNKISLLNI